MEKKKFSQLKWILPIIFLAIIVFITGYKIIKNRENKQYKVLYSKIEYATKECFLKGECSGYEITLNDLYEKGYIKEELYDPITKELLNKDTKIKYRNDKVLILH